MLSISSINAGQAASYYQKDNYYTRDITQTDKWQGRLGKSFGLHMKQLEPTEFNTMIRSSATKCAGYDLSFSAPKSVSIAAMATTEDIKADMLVAHDRAVEKALKEIEQREIAARVTKSGQTCSVKTGKMLAAKVKHYVSRNNDMQLHTHAVVLNQTEHNGKLYAVDGRNLYKNELLYGQVYRNELARQLQHKGYAIEVTDAEKGLFELKGVSSQQIEAFSSRRAEIQAQIKAWGTNDAKSIQKAVMMTRSAKEHRDLQELRAAWKETVQELGGLNVSQQVRAIQYTPKEMADAFAQALDKLEQQKFAWTEKEFARAVLREGLKCGVQQRDFEQMMKKNERLVNLGNATGNLQDIYYSTEHNIRVEQEITKNIELTRGRMHGILQEQVKRDIRKISIEKSLTLSKEQIGAIKHIVTEKDQFCAVQGLAGTGKTYMLSAAREVWEKNDYIVRGASFTGKAAEGLQLDANIDSSTIHSLLNRLEKEAGNAIYGEDYTKKTTWNFTGLKAGGKQEVWVIDEVGLTDNNLMLHLEKAAMAKQAKVVMVGDYQQLTPVGVGNAYSSLVQSGKISTCFLSDIRRQKNEYLLQAVRESVKGDIHKSVELVANSTKEISSPAKRFAAITKEFVELSGSERACTVILTAKNIDRVKLNASIRQSLIKNGDLQIGNAFKIQTGKSAETIRNFAPGDKILFFQNDRNLGVMNGQAGKILTVEENRIVVESSGRQIIFDPRKYNHIDHGYAMTTHKAQGITVDRVIINIDSSQKKLNSRNSYYVDISRARHKISIYTDSKEKLGEQVGKWEKKITSNDFVQKNILDRPKFYIRRNFEQKITSLRLPATARTLLLKAVDTPIKILEKSMTLVSKPVVAVDKFMNTDKMKGSMQRRGFRM